MSVATKPVKRAKAVYPGKREMNLHYKPDRTTGPTTVALYVLFVLALLLAAAKFLVYDPLVDLAETREALARVEAVKADYDARLEEYPEVKRQYQLYAATDEELSQTDRLEVLELVDKVIRPRAQVGAISIGGGSVSLQMSGVTLEQTAEIVRQVKESPLVYRAVVSTAATGADEEQVVTADLTILLQKESEVEK